MQDEVFHYRGFWNSEGRCRLRLFRLDGGAVVVIASEVPDNPGTSVTNLAEGLATAIYQREEIAAPDLFTWIEHYPVESAPMSAAVRGGDTYDLVEFSYDPTRRALTNPRWSPLTPDDVEKMTGLDQKGVSL